MATDYDRLRAALESEISEPGPITKDEAREVLRLNPPQTVGEFADDDFDPLDFT